MSSYTQSLSVTDSDILLRDFISYRKCLSIQNPLWQELPSNSDSLSIIESDFHFRHFGWQRCLSIQSPCVTDLSQTVTKISRLQAIKTGQELFSWFFRYHDTKCHYPELLLWGHENLTSAELKRIKRKIKNAMYFVTWNTQKCIHINSRVFRDKCLCFNCIVCFPALGSCFQRTVLSKLSTFELHFS